MPASDRYDCYGHLWGAAPCLPLPQRPRALCTSAPCQPELVPPLPVPGPAPKGLTSIQAWRPRPPPGVLNPTWGLGRRCEADAELVPQTGKRHANDMQMSTSGFLFLERWRGSRRREAPPRKGLTSPAGARASWLAPGQVEAGSWLPSGEGVAGGCALECPLWAWTMLGVGVGGRRGLGPGEAHWAMTFDLWAAGPARGGSQAQAGFLLSGTSVFTGVSSVPQEVAVFSPWEDQDLCRGTQEAAACV